MTPAAVRDAAGDEHRRLVSFAQRQLAGEPRLADPRFADDGDDAAAAGVARGDERSVQVVELLGAADERRIETPLVANERVSALVEPDPADTGELDGARDDGSGALDDLAGRDSRGQAELMRRQDGPLGVVVGRSLGAEDGDEPLGAEPLERAAVPAEHVPHRCERLVEQPFEPLGIVSCRRRRREDGHEPELRDLPCRRIRCDL